MPQKPSGGDWINDFMNNIKIQLKNYYIRYAIVFIAVAIIVFYPFLSAGRSFVWYKDGYQQNYRALAYYSVWLRKLVSGFLHGDFSVPAWSFGLGYGADIITTLSYYSIGGPIYTLSALVPRECIAYFYSFAEIARFFFSGLFFSMYIRYIYRKSALSDYAVMAGAFMYAFSAHSMVYIRHPYFLYPVEYFPLILLGIEMLLAEKKGSIFSLAVFLSAVSNFYFFYTLAIFSSLYFLWRICTEYRPFSIKEAVNVVGRALFYALTGVLMSAVILYPVILRVISDPRRAPGYVVDPLFKTSYYFMYISGFLGINNNSYGIYMGYGAMGLLSCAALFIRIDGDSGTSETAVWRKRLKWVFAFMTVLTLIPFVSYVLQGFTYVSGRWLWAYAFIVAVIAVEMSGSFAQLDKRSALKFIIFLIVSMAFCFIWKGRITANVLIQFILGFVFLILILMIRFLHRNIERFNILPAFAVFVILGIAVNGYFLYNTAQEGYSEDFSPYVDFDPVIETDKEKTPDEWCAAVKNNFWISEAGIIRDYDANTEQNAFIRMSGQRFTENASLQAGISSTQYFWSLSDKNVWKFFGEVASPEIRAYHYDALDDRTILNALAAVNYYSVPYGTDLPYGFEKNGLDTGTYSDVYEIHRGNKFLPFGTAFSSYCVREDYEKADPLGKQDLLLDAVVMDAPEDELQGLKRVQPLFEAKELRYSVECDDSGISFADGKINVTESDASINLLFEGEERSETYFYINGLGFRGEVDPLELTSPNNSVIDVQFFNKDRESCRKGFDYRTNRHNKYTGKHEFMVNSIYSEEPWDGVRITFSEKGTYTFDELKVYSVPIDTIDTRIESLKAGDTFSDIDLHYRDDTYSTDRITGRINAGEKEILLLQMPFSKGWRAFVDGNRTPLYQADTMFTALILDKGEHDILLKYSTPGLKTGIVLSLIGILLFLLSLREFLPVGKNDGKITE